MSNYEATVKTGHPVAGIVLGILGIFTALLLTLLFGALAGAIAAALGIMALLLGIGARKGQKRGMGAIVTGALAMVMAVVMTLTSVGMMKVLHEEAEKSGIAPVFVECFRTPYMGLMSVAVNVAGSHEKMDALLKELDALKALDTEKTAVTAAVLPETAAVR